MKSVFQELRDLAKYRWVVFASVYFALKLRYKRSFLGFFWSFLGPLLNYGTLAVVFYFGLKIKTEGYLTYILPGILFYSLFSATLISSATSLITNEGFIKKVYLPKSIFVINSTLIESSNFLFNLISVSLILFALGSPVINASSLMIPVLLAIYLFFILGLGLICGVVGVFFRDTLHVIPLGLQAIFYASPILYDESIIPSEYQFIFKYNPTYIFIKSFRGIVQTGEVIPMHDLLLCTLFALISMSFGIFLLKKLENEIIFKL